jgi:hypothetical protein
VAAERITMAPLRPIGHIAANLQILAVSVCYRLRMAADGQRYLCWADDDGCVYLALTHHPRAIAVARHCREHVVRTYGKPKSAPFPLNTADVFNDLQDARTAQASRHVHEANLEALHA